MPGILFPIAIVGGLALLALSSSSSSSTQAGPKRTPPPKPIEPILDLSTDDKSKVITEGYKPIITGESTAWTPTVDDILAAQKCLQALGYDIGAAKPDGKIGPKTKAALLAFQKKYGLKEQTGTLTKETADLVCGAEKTKMSSSQGRSAGQQDKMAGLPRATDFAVRATQAGVDPTNADVLTSFRDGYNVGYDEASPGGSAPVSDPVAAAAAKKLGYDTGYNNAKAGNAIDASDAFDASGLTGEYPSFKEGYNAGYAAGSSSPTDGAGDAVGKATDILGGVFGNSFAEGRLPVSVASLYPQTVVYDAQGRPRLQRIG